jgi:prepilin-type N-terminal cleavage/methylation domain-containing protein
VKKTAKERGGFTLVELIIVIIIIGILAALAIPQFVSSTQDAQEATLSGDLAVMRNAINLYYHQHGSTYPGEVKTDGSGAATLAGENPAAFINQLTQYTNAAGAITTTLNRATHPFGPYLMRGIPDNPLADVNADADNVNVEDTNDPLLVDGAPLTGWKFSKNTGEFVANTATYISW